MTGVNAVTISSLVTNTVTSTGFNTTIGFAGDSNANAACTLSYCNATDNPACSVAGSIAMTRGLGQFTHSLTGLSTPNDPGDALKLSVSCTDTDGVSGSPLSGTLVTPDTLAPGPPTGLTLQ